MERSIGEEREILLTILRLGSVCCCDSLHACKLLNAGWVMWCDRNRLRLTERGELMARSLREPQMTRERFAGRQ
jgi:hypothetical protein